MKLVKRIRSLGIGNKNIQALDQVNKGMQTDEGSRAQCLQRLKVNGQTGTNI